MSNKSIRQRRIFSEDLRKQIVSSIENGEKSIRSASREYGVYTTTVYRWLNKYSRHLQSSPVMVVQMESESYKNKEYEKRIRELEAALGRKQLELDYLNKLLEIGQEELGIDLKKKSVTPPSTGSVPTKKDTDTK